MANYPWEAGDDPRRMTDLPTGPYLEAAKAWGGCMEKYAGDTTAHTWAWESFLAALRVYEFERAKEQFTMEDMNLMRVWFNAVEDLSPEYLEQKDRDLMQKIAKVWFKTGTAPQSDAAGQTERMTK